MQTPDRVARLLPLVAPDPIEPAEITAAEAALGRPFPDEYRAWLARAGVSAAEEYELFLDPLLPSSDAPDGVGAVATQGDALRALHWALPDELVPVGGNGAGELFGLWMPRDRAEAPVVVGFDMALQEEDESLWILGSSWLAFVEGWLTVYADRGEPDVVWDTLGIPEELRVEDPEEDEPFDAMLQHASPGWPEVAFLWSDRGFDAAGLRTLLARRGKQP